MNNPELVQNEDGTWSLKSLSDASVALGPYQRLIDALYERERIQSGAMPPFGRWVIHGVEEVEPIRFDGESDEEMRSANTLGKTLHLRDWEYECLLEIERANSPQSISENTYSDEFETKFHYAVQQRSIAPFLSDSDKSTTAPIQRKQTIAYKVIGFFNIAFSASAFLVIGISFFGSSPIADDEAGSWGKLIFLYLPIVWGATAYFFFNIRLWTSKVARKGIFHLNLYPLLLLFGLLILERISWTDNPFVTKHMMDMVLFFSPFILLGISNLYFCVKSDSAPIL
jgi:hypothetical protein